MTTDRYVVIGLGTGTGNSGLAFGISEDGSVVGVQEQVADSTPATTPYRLVLWQHASPTDAIDLTAFGIDEIVGFNGSGDLIARRANDLVLYSPRTGTVTPMPNALAEITPPAGFAVAQTNGFNQRGEQVGVLFVHPDDPTGAPGLVPTGARAFVATGGNVRVLDPAPGGDRSSAFDINNAGWVVGGAAAIPTADIPPGRAFRYESVAGTMTDLGTLPNYTASVATGINELGDIVGFAYGPTKSSARRISAFLFDGQTNTMHDLNELTTQGEGWVLSVATDINDAGMIVGWGADGVHEWAQPFLLRPQQ